MRSSGLLLLLPVVLLAPVATLSCTSVTGPSFPLGAAVVPPSFTTLSVKQLPPACSGQSTFEGSSSLCPSGLTYFLCDGNAYTEYDCSDPGSGWALETLSEDQVATGPSPCGSSAGQEGTVYVESSLASPGENAILVFRYCQGTLPSQLVGRYLTGGSGAADLNDDGILDADQQVVVNASQTLLFAVNQGSDSIAAFHVDDAGLLTPVTGSPFPSGGVAPASIGLAGDLLVVANKASDGVRSLGKVAPNYATFTIQSDGSLTATGSTFPLPAGASPTQAYVAPGPASLGPGGQLVFATEESGVLRAFELSAAGDLTLAPGSPVSLPNSLFADGRRPDPVWPAGLSASPTQSILYTGVPNNDSIAAFGFTDTGQLSLLNGEHDGPGAKLPCWSLVNADSSRLYFANAGSDSVSVWDVGTDPSQPSLLQTFQMTGGGNPWGLHLDPTGQLLFVITPRQVREVPEGQGQLLHGLQLAADGTVGDEIHGSPVPIPVPTDTNVVGVAVVAAQP